MENHHEDLLKQQQDFERQGRHSPQGMGGEVGVTVVE